MDFVQSGVDIDQFCSSAAQTYKNYKKIGNIVGAKQARAWWIKKITGLRPLGRASSAKTWTTRFKNNLTNQTSPFHTQWKGIVEDASIKEENVEYDRETGKYYYPILDGLPIDFDEDELREFLYNNRKVINVTAKISIQVNEMPCGTIFTSRKRG